MNTRITLAQDSAEVPVFYLVDEHEHAEGASTALGLPTSGSEMDLIRWWRDYMRKAPSFAMKSAAMSSVVGSPGVTSRRGSRSGS